MDADMGTPPWTLILRGVIALVFGILALVWPGLTLLWLVLMFAAFAIFGGAVSIIAALQERRTESGWWIPLLLGIVSVIAGVYAIGFPGLTALVLVLVMGVNALFTGGLDIAHAVRLRGKAASGRGMLVLSGAVSVLFGALVIWAPGAGALALVWLVSLYAIVTGGLLLALGLRMQRIARTSAPRPMPASDH